MSRAFGYRRSVTLQLSLAEKFLAPTFMTDGWSAFKNPAEQTTFSEVTLKRMASLARLPEDPETVIKILGAVQMTAGALLFTGRLRRLSSAALALTLVPTTFGKPTGGTFGLADTPAHPGTGARARAGEQRATQRRNLALLGGLVLVFADLGGAPSLSWRAARGVRKAKTRTTQFAEHAGNRISSVTADTSAPLLDGLKPRLEELSDLAAATVHRVSGEAAHFGGNVGSSLGSYVGDLRGHLAQVGERVGDFVGEHVGDLSSQAADVGSHVSELGRAGSNQLMELGKTGSSQLLELGKAGSNQLMELGSSAAHGLERTAPRVAQTSGRLAHLARVRGERLVRR